METEVQIPAPLCTSCVNLGKSLYLVGPPLSHLKMGDDNVCLTTEVW